MDQLDKLKKEWQNREQELPKLSYNSIYNMLLKKSSSIVKWIFIISIIELLFWIGLNLVIPEDNLKLINEMGIGDIMHYSNIVHFIIFGVFIFLFYKNHQSIKVTDSTKMLMQNILKTRKTVRYFVYYNVGMLASGLIITDIYFYSRSQKLYEIMNFASKGIPEKGFATTFIISQIIVGILVVGLLIAFYWLIYGILLKRLNNNYKELKKMDD
ncbi:hypothetical protein OAD06_02735 [Flavobacteriaceae bacterium]|jgi:hypothetical protein|nr:hypothetical protein [Flavobacteriaceae bacterium]|tara:strand:+ start:175 stop:813 length:639 start_codon:yes stop_codon:yes gene_type:complete